jgi:3-phosphoshikimate 1-carboxyvinyltransferase
MVEGRGGRVAGGGRLALRDSGTSLRLLLAVASLGESVSSLDGSPRLRERPIEPLVRALRGLGARVTGAAGAAGLPLEAGGRRPAGGAVSVEGGLSSQFASALLLVAPRLENGLDLTLVPPVVSLPYVELTVSVLARFGVAVERPAALRYVVRRSDYAGCRFTVEGDHSSASYFLAAAAIVGGAVRVTGILPDSGQPDARLAAILAAAGCAVRRGRTWIEVRGGKLAGGIDVDLQDAPDLAPTVAVVASFAPGPSVIRGVAHLRWKESDRLGLLAQNLTALGRPAEAHADRLELGAARGELHGALVRTGSDHRMAMAFAVAGLRLGLELDDADCVTKSNPGFWQQLARLQRSACRARGRGAVDQNW